ncbi:hypothetical protein [Vibrio lentus]|uniref:hypothetical protein n=1 Tax=Vibrio lentus TaxID=136468 RepID=UPI000C836785|nr:hypothetical protein [Vibrio lentus]
MDNEKHDLICDSNHCEEKIAEEYKKTKNVINLRCPLTAKSLVIPALKYDKQPERYMVFLETNNPYKQLLYKVVIVAYNYAFLDESASLSAKGIVSQSVHKFIDWLNSAKISNPYEILKEYESYHFDLLNNHGGYSALIPLRTVFFYALEQSNELRKNIAPEQLQYLQFLNTTKISSNLNKKQDSLASYFGGLDWLRRDDVGVGSELYQVLASPKITMDSFKITVSTIMTELYKCKSILKKFLLENDFVKYSYKSETFQKETKFFRATYVGKYIYYLICKYHENNDNSRQLRCALEIVLLSNVTNKNNLLKVLPALESKEKMGEIFHPKRNNGKKISTDFTSKVFVRSCHGSLFSFDYLMSLVTPDSEMSVTKLDALMFSWLMASLSVQPSDISKLAKNSFRFLKVGRRVTHIECEYFKSRSDALHNTRSLSTRKKEGKALYLYLKQHKGEKVESFNGGSPVISTGCSSVSGLLFEILGLNLVSERIILAHRGQGGVPPSFYKVLKALSNGKHTENIVSAVKKTPIEERKKLVDESETPCPTNFFGFQAIKNSSVHAYSDPYTLHFLTNRNSHTNQTEKRHYLNADNEEWLNASGRITRNVMIDLINNVFNLGFENLGKDRTDELQAKFNSEFTSLADNLSYKSGEMISRLKIVTGQQKGKVNEVGVLSISDQSTDEIFNPIYVLDSPVTVFKIMNYQHEFSENYKKLLNNNPNFLFRTAMPTIEWMEHVLDKMSNNSLKEGKALFNKMRDRDVSISVFHSV